MISINKALGIGALVLTFSGCGVNQSDEDKYQTIKGIPISVAESHAHYSGALVTILNMEGRRVLAYSYKGGSIRNARATALIQSEISDGDEEPVELMGRFDEDNDFMIKKVTANGHQVYFPLD